MENETKYIIWSEGGVTFIGIEESHLVGTDVWTVRDPMALVFSTKEEPAVDAEGNTILDSNGNPKTRGRLMMEFYPWLFGVAIEEGENTWEVKCEHVLTGAKKLHDEIIRGYERERLLSGKAPATK